jgi:hypothetical protein
MRLQVSHYHHRLHHHHHHPCSGSSSIITHDPSHTLTERLDRHFRFKRVVRLLKWYARTEPDDRFDYRFTKCEGASCPRAQTPPAACPDCEKFESQLEAYLTFLKEQFDVVCTYCDRKFHSRTKYCKAVRLESEWAWADVAVFGALRHLPDPRDSGSCPDESLRAIFEKSHIREEDGSFTNLICPP